MILAFAAKNKWQLHQMDVVTAFLNGSLEDEFYMEIPEGFPGHGDPTKVCRLNKALYGLKQSSRVWLEQIREWLIKQNLTQSVADSNLFYSIVNEKYTLVLIYVDDILLTRDNNLKQHDLQVELAREFEMIDLGEAENYLGTEFIQTSSGILVHQEGYISKILEKFGMMNCTSISLSMESGCKLRKDTRTNKIDP